MTKERALQKATQYRIWADKREQLLKTLETQNSLFLKSFDWTEPIKIGHHSQKRHQKMFELRNSKMEKIIELEKSIKRMREKASNLEIFANTNKGDAEKRRQQQRDANDQKIKVGDIVKTIYGMREVVKINKKTYTIKCNTSNITIDKSFIL